LKIGRKAGFQGLPCAVKPGFDGSNRKVEYLGHLVIGNVLKIPE
jgi:hypothetical protein